ncbi:hypothetical protein [Aromatoleum diolicum]|uniref:Uncharacterized protein n=1 Tax=Aromatoleum diolicum TaxID=75796 RepID=A0ABX1QJ95_9RHOO|nr:hypothetical protein [Aromatoleum diolicum]NMG77626.1 hypothetical protein [Aromatoleum diolicum]
MQTSIRSCRSLKPASITRFLACAALVLGVQAVSVAGESAAPVESREPSTAAAVGHTVGGTMRDIGTGARDAGREVGHGAAEAGRNIGHTVRDAAVVTWHGIGDAGRAIGRTARDGSKAFVRGLKGESQR